MRMSKSKSKRIRAKTKRQLTEWIRPRMRQLT